MFAKPTTDDYRHIDIREFDRDYLQPGESSSWRWLTDRGDVQASIAILCESRHRLRFVYSVTNSRGDETSHNYPVRLDWTECHFGGERPWFLCPGEGCGRRCAILYGGELFVCRECRDLTYQSCQVSGNALLEAWHKARKMAERYDGNLEGASPQTWTLGDRPKHMHRATWQDICDEFADVKQQAIEAIRRKMPNMVGLETS
jgi:hypothetical protein